MTNKGWVLLIAPNLVSYLSRILYLPQHSTFLADQMSQSKPDHMALHHSLGAILYYPHEYPVLEPTSEYDQSVCHNKRNATKEE